MRFCTMLKQCCTMLNFSRISKCFRFFFFFKVLYYQKKNTNYSCICLRLASKTVQENSSSNHISYLISYLVTQYCVIFMMVFRYKNISINNYFFFINYSLSTRIIFMSASNTRFELSKRIKLNVFNYDKWVKTF